jgi:hypothetical protein
MFNKILSLILVFLIPQICNLTYSQEKLSGLYSGIIDYEVGSGFDTMKGWIAFDFTNKQLNVLYDGIFLERIKLDNNYLIDSGGVMCYPDNIIGTFIPGKNIFIYNYRKFDNGENLKKSILKKSGDKTQALKLIHKYKEENAKFKIFYIGLKNIWNTKEYSLLNAFFYFPFNYLGEDVHSITDLLTLYSKSFQKVSEQQINDMDFSRLEDHAKNIPDGVYIMNIGCSLHVKLFESEFKIFEYLCYN